MLIAMIMTGIVIYLFSQTQRGTRISLAKAQLMLTATTVDSRLRMDAATIQGPDRTLASASAPNPTAGGCLLIVPGLREGYVPLPNGQMSKNKVRLRSDQLVFLSKRDATKPHPWVSMLPLQQNQAPSTASISPASSWEARIWYGAVKDGNYTAGDGSSGDVSLHAHLWLVGRQAKLLVQDQKAGALDCTVTTSDDTTAGALVKATTTVWPGLKDAALAGGWTDDDYVANLIGTGMTPAEQKNRDARIPVTTPTIDLKQLQQGDTNSGIQLSDIADSHLRLFENCSEIVVQWAGDLDKDGQIDTYPANHPLAGAIIWYPEELHTNAQKDATTKTHLTGSTLAQYNAIATNPWSTKSFPTGFAPSLAAWPSGRFGGGTWPNRFQFDYGETDNKPNQTGNAAVNVPKPYVFRFDDDQFRLVRFGYRQDGSCYKNRWDTFKLPNPDKTTLPQPQPPINGLHCFPYPPGFDYTGKTAPAGPYPITGATVTAAATGAGDGTNFGDLMGAQMLPGDAMVGANLSVTGPNGEKYRTGGTGNAFLADGVTPDPMQYGMWVKSSAGPGPWLTWPAPTPTLTLTTPDSTGAVAPALYSAAQIAALTAATIWPYYAGGKLIAIQQIDGTQIGTGVAKPAGDPTPDTPAASIPSAANQVDAMTRQFGTGNNFTVTYSDIFAEYLKTINNPAQAADANPKSREDWRMPQSDWPRLIRLRVRLHDSQGLVTSYSDEALINGRDDDGDGVVDNPEEGRISGIWFEYIFAVPYPIDPSPRQH